jgi:hypothetical protein
LKQINNYFFFKKRRRKRRKGENRQAPEGRGIREPGRGPIDHNHLIAGRREHRVELGGRMNVHERIMCMRLCVL